jgi:hypothetical protein
VIRSSVALSFVLLLLSGCPTKSREQAPLPSSSAAVPAPSASAVAPSPWYVGDWRGKYDARSQSIDVAADAGRMHVWDEDDASQGTGAGKLEITIDAAGIARGKSRGPLGELVVSGAVEDDSVRLRLLPPAGTRGPAFAGYVVLDHREGKLTGSLRASSGDSALVRRAEVTLEKRTR